MMKEVELSCGLTVRVQENAIMDDYDTFRAVVELEKGNMSALGDIERNIVGQENMEEIKRHLREETGKASVTDVMTAISEILKAVTPKNS